MITADGCWAHYRTDPEVTRGRPCLFLDRDGVLIEDTGYPHDPAGVVLVPEVLAGVAAARRAGFVVGIVSNQSGIGRGYFGWDGFAAVQAMIDAALARSGATLDFVLACPHHPQATVQELKRDHEWRKPAPGMLLAAAARLNLDVARSVMLGDRETDLTAATSAGIGHGLLLGGPDGVLPRNGAVARRDLVSVLRRLSGPQVAGV